MQIVPIKHGLTVGVSTAPRSAGLHVSDIYNNLYQKLEPKRYTGGEPDPLRLEAGLALEAMLEEGLKARVGQRPSECISSEGIAYSPDLLMDEDERGERRVGEIKLTWMSSRDVPREPSGRFPPKFDKWFTQIKAYCRCLNTPYARLYVFFVNGNYKPPSPELLAWDIEFTQQELDEEWSMLMNHARAQGMLT